MVLEIVADLVVIVCEAVMNALAALLEPLVMALVELLVLVVELVVSGLFLLAGLLRASSASRFKISQTGRRWTRRAVYVLLAAAAVSAAWWWLRPKPQPAPTQSQPTRRQQALDAFDKIKRAVSGKDRE